MRLVQLNHPKEGRHVALVREPDLILLETFHSTYELAWAAIQKKMKLSEITHRCVSEYTLDYDSIYHGRSPWQLLPPVDHPKDLNSCLIAGTGLTHRSSALNRNAMHEEMGPEQMTDSMKMYQLGLQGGHPAEGEIGVQPEWFYKGNGSILKGHGAPLVVPPYALDGGEEPEIAGVYLVDKDGTPWRIGFVTANEFSDHKMEKQNYLYLAPSKIRDCSIGPELVLDVQFENVSGTVSVQRGREIIWSTNINSGQKNMCHSLANLEYHHFKYNNHRLSGQLHVHFFGADAFSFGAGVLLENEDIMQVEWEGMGRALSNPILVDKTPEKMFNVNCL